MNRTYSFLALLWFAFSPGQIRAQFNAGAGVPPYTVTADLQLKNNLVLQGKAFTQDALGEIVPGTKYSVYHLTDYDYLPPVLSNDKGGLQITVFKGKIDSPARWDALPQLQGGVVASTGFGANELYAAFKGIPAWASGQIPGSALDYPARLIRSGAVAAGGDLDNYSARAVGEIYLAKGSYTFRDGNDDYARLVVNGQTLFNDDSWTNFAGAANNFGGVAPGSETPLSITTDGWYPIEFNMAEAGGGDNWRLLWDRQSSPDDTGAMQDASSFSSIAGKEWYQVPENLFRQTQAPRTDLRIQRLISEYNPGIPGISVAALTGTDLGSPNTWENIAGHCGPLSLPRGRVVRLEIVASFDNLAVSKEIVIDYRPVLDFCFTSLDRADFNCSGRVDLADFSILRANFNKNIDACGGTPIPEPPRMAWQGLSMTLVLLGQRHRLQRQNSKKRQAHASE